MKTHTIIIAVAVVVILVLAGVAVRQNGKLTDAAESLSSEKARTADLQGKVSSLEQEVAKLKETSDYYYQQGVDFQSSGNLADAKAAFEAVVAKFPTSNLVGSARQRLAAVNQAIAEEDAERTRREAATGERIDFASFSAKARSSGLQVGKRYRFECTPGGNLTELSPPGEGGTSGTLWGVVPDFDDPAQEEAVLKRLVGAQFPTYTVVASMGNDGKIHIHRVE